MEKVPYSKYTKELRQEAVRLVTEGGLSVGEASMRLSLPKSTLENWLRAFKAGKLERIGANHRPLTDVEMELSRVNQRPRKTLGYQSPAKKFRDCVALTD
jgi:transposase